MSDSEPSYPVDIPAADVIERLLRRVVRELNEKDEIVTVNKVREVAESNLGLDQGYFKETPSWKQRSKDIITNAVEQGEDQSSPEKPTKAAPPKAKPAPKARRKRKSDEDAPAKKRPAKKIRKAESEEDESELELSDEEKEVVKSPAKKLAKRAPRKTKKVVSKPELNGKDEESDLTHAKPVKRAAKTGKAMSRSEETEMSHVEHKRREAKEDDEEGREQGGLKAKPTALAIKDESELSDVPDKVKDDEAKPHSNEAAPEDDESDLSSLIDEQPAQKKKQRKRTASEPKSNSKAASKTTEVAKPKARKVLSADEEEIKRLQGWLVKCGIRKMWWKELAPYPTGKEKIRHLKKMLDDAGMSGRYSNEKAKQIKESRELAAELEAVEEFNERWGQSDEEGGRKEEKDDDDHAMEEEGGAAPKRRLPRGFVDFGDSGDEGSD